MNTHPAVQSVPQNRLASLPATRLISSRSRLCTSPRAILGLLAAFWVLTFCGNATAQEIPGWTLVWADEFDQPDGSSPDSAKWTFDIGATGWGNNEWQYYTSRTNNARIENGCLVIEAKAEQYQGANYTSARLKTQGKASWTYGRIEARIQIPRGQGIWPAFWMLGTNITSVGWPNCGEIDIMENIGKEPTLVHGTIHGPGYSGGNAVGGQYSHPDNAPFADDFHIYAVEWTTNLIQWFVNGEQYFTATPASVRGAPWVFTQPQFLILNVAVGGNWPGYPDETTVFPQRMLVDYVRVYAKSNPPPTVSGALINGNFETGLLAPWVGKDYCCANPQGGNITDTNGLVWDPTLNGPNNQGIRNPAFGAYACKLYGNFSGGPNNPGFYQDVDVVPGTIWSARIRARTESPDHIRDANHAKLEVSFFDDSGTVLAKYVSATFDTGMPVNTWVTLGVQQQVLPVTAPATLMHAPPGAVKMRFEVTFSQQLWDWGSIYFDEAQLQEIVRPRLSATLTPAGEIEITFQTQEGVTYQVLCKDLLADEEWTPLAAVPGDGMIQTVSCPVTAESQLYTVRLE
ncbi:MAG TPA: glycoside hydrolase family 16 protein [Verrucomicrobia bacterium]|nr:glycoside hydrolase family 16 protein [Verrucomicrobiota bacterium]HOP96798.1 glycoside hydrolase family 16 protein [Verrucomicrobiota bacterium]